MDILNLIKLEERMFYDSWWLVETNLGNIKLHQYNDVEEIELKGKLEICTCLEDVKELEPKNFYFD
jgi:hypothetical protein